MYQNLKLFRESLSMTQKEFAAALGIGQTTYNGYETGARDPKSDFWVAVAQKYNVSIDYLMGRRSDPHPLPEGNKKAPSLSDGAMQLGRDYDALDTWGKQAVRELADTELARVEDESRFLAETALAPEPKAIPLFLSPAAAGIAAPIMGEDYEDYTLAPEDPQGAMFAVRVQGDSMAPHFPDGSTVFCSKDPLQDGDIGVFAVDGGSVVKQYHKEGGIVYLFSLNRQREDADVVLPSTSGRGFACMGRVITKRRFPVPGR